MTGEVAMDCPKNCGGSMKELVTSSEPEGIRRDRQCRRCGRRYMVTKAALIEMRGRPEATNDDLRKKLREMVWEYGTKAFESGDFDGERHWRDRAETLNEVLRRL